MKQEEADKIFEQQRVWGKRQFRVLETETEHLLIEEWDYLSGNDNWEIRDSYQAIGMRKLESENSQKGDTE